MQNSKFDMYKNIISKECCFDLKNVGRDINEFVFFQNIKWFEIFDSKPVFNILTLLNYEYFTFNSKLYMVNDGEILEVVNINRGSPFKNLSKKQEKYIINYKKNHKMHILTLTYPIIKNDIFKNKYIFKNDSFYIQLIDNSKFFLENNIQTSKLILDLRKNGGGRISDLKRIVGYFIGNDINFIELSGKNEKYFIRTVEKKRIFFKDLIIFIDSKTCSSAELLIITLQKYFKTLIIGNVSKGKWVITKIKKIGDYYIKIPILKVENRKSGIGIVPDIICNDVHNFFNM